MTADYPISPAERAQWIVQRRGSRHAVDPERPVAAFVEKERSAMGVLEDVATIFLTNKECPWKCTMCDLWRNTTQNPVAPAQILRQMQNALAQSPTASVLKLYNSGSFFDQGAIPRSAWQEIARLCQSFRHLIVECHPRLVGTRILDFLSLLPCSLEVALGLETAHPSALEKLNKRSTVPDYQRAASFLKQNRIAVRTFLLVYPPFIPEAEQNRWLEHSIDAAFQAGSDVISLIPLRPGNGAIEELIKTGDAVLPSLQRLEEAQEQGLQFAGGRTFADTWDLRLFTDCRPCFKARERRIARMNRTQKIENRVACAVCGNG